MVGVGTALSPKDSSTGLNVEIVPESRFPEIGRRFGEVDVTSWCHTSHTHSRNKTSWRINDCMVTVGPKLCTISLRLETLNDSHFIAENVNTVVDGFGINSTREKFAVDRQRYWVRRFLQATAKDTMSHLHVPSLTWGTHCKRHSLFHSILECQQLMDIPSAQTDLSIYSCLQLKSPKKRTVTVRSQRCLFGSIAFYWR